MFVERKGHPMLRARHMPFPIGVKERDQWLACMHKAMDAQPMSAALRQHLEGALFKTADWMRNQPG